MAGAGGSQSAEQARTHFAHKIAAFIKENAFLEAEAHTAEHASADASAHTGEDPAAGLAEAGPTGDKECRRILSTWMAKCTIGGAGGDTNLPGGEEKKPSR